MLPSYIPVLKALNENHLSLFSKKSFKKEIKNQGVKKNNNTQ